MTGDPMNDLYFVEAVSQQWVEAVVMQGNRCIDALGALRSNLSGHQSD